MQGGLWESATYQPPLESDGVDVEVLDEAQVVVHVLQAAQHLQQAAGHMHTQHTVVFLIKLTSKPNKIIFESKRGKI